MNTAEVEKINKTVGVLETLQDALGPAIIIIENMMQQNQAMHQSLRMENERLKTEINEVREEKQKLKDSSRVVIRAETWYKIQAATGSCAGTF